MKTEIWKSIIGYEGLYEISSLGRVRSLARKNGLGSRLKTRILAPVKGHRYLSVLLSKKGKRYHFLSHRLIALAFIPNPNNYPQINHKDGDRLNNDIENLEWVDAFGNMQHAAMLGLIGGEKHGGAKLTTGQVKEIRNSYPLLNYQELSKIYGISDGTVYKIIKRKSWKFA